MGEGAWNYRYTWIRDSSFTLYGLMRLGYTQEAAAFMRWVTARCGELEPDRALLIMYGLDGRHVVESLPRMGSNAAQLFSAFFTTKSGGMGMGLSISRSIIQAHGGRLWATSNPAHGATFQFVVPAIR